MSTSHEPTLNLGIIGSGSGAKLFASAIQSVPGMAFWSCYSRERSRAERLATDFGARASTAAHTTIESLLADPNLHAVVVASPDGLHHAHVLAAAAAGKHVLVEKPMAIDVQQAEEMIAACAEAKVRLSVGYRARWHGGHRWIAEHLHQGAFGRLRHVHASWSYRDVDRDNWRYSGKLGPWGALSKLGTHLVDFALCMSGREGAIADLRSVLVHNGPNDESAVLSWRHQSGSTAEIYASVALGDGESRAELHCDNALITLENTFGVIAGGRIVVNGEPLMFDVVKEIEGELSDLRRAIIENAAPMVGGDIGRLNVDVLSRATKAR